MSVTILLVTVAGKHLITLSDFVALGCYDWVHCQQFHLSHEALALHMLRAAVLP